MKILYSHPIQTANRKSSSLEAEMYCSVKSSWSKHSRTSPSDLRANCACGFRSFEIWLKIKRLEIEEKFKQMLLFQMTSSITFQNSINLSSSTPTIVGYHQYRMVNTRNK
ncbi:hypothetical protein AVEN_270570-1 [Araneus ventricosus]|uniref:Uncharacterized protein n=1 Tax=Araneus ventricosus TaxID=182803 RepID=A0A4Y2B536_ARAVE|nr:hypothetical protein AVEN_270570-1 [Araneus ventricosus]